MRQAKSRVVVVTGGAGGIGQGIVDRFAQENDIVIVWDTKETGLNSVESKAGPDSHSILTSKVDISNEVEVKAAVQSLLTQHGTIDVLVNNAAKFVLKGLEATTRDWEESLRVNLHGTINCTKHIAGVMKQNKTGAIINIASISGLIAQPHFMTYSATKAMLIQVTKNLALDLGKDGIRVNCVSPGTIITDASAEHAKQLGITLAEFKEIEAAKTPLHQVGTSEDVANAVYFLASPEAAFITGANLMIDGGYTII